jgi:hypothetical protein
MFGFVANELSAFFMRRETELRGVLAIFFLLLPLGIIGRQPARAVKNGQRAILVAMHAHFGF